MEDSGVDDPWADDLKLAGRWTYSDGKHVVLGVDGGASTTICVAMIVENNKASFVGGSEAADVLKTVTSRITGRAVAGSSNPNSVGDDAARLAVETAMAGALRQGALPRAAVRGVCIGMAGISRAVDVEKVHSWMEEVFAHEVRVSVHNDAVAALASGTGGTPVGCVLIAGTGTIALGFAEDGSSAQAAGGGPLLGDGGSGHWIGQQALTAALKDADGRGPATRLTDTLLSYLGLSIPADLIGWAYEDTGWARVASLVPAVRQCARDGDPEAERILRAAVHELASSVLAVVRRVQLAGPGGDLPFSLVLVGGVLKDRATWDLGEDIVVEIKQSLPSVRPIWPQVEPAVGAALLAWQDCSQ